MKSPTKDKVIHDWMLMVRGMASDDEWTYEENEYGQLGWVVPVRFYVLYPFPEDLPLKPYTLIGPQPI